MPHIHIQVSGHADDELAGRVAASARELTSHILRKDPALTAVIVDFIDPARWFVAGRSLASGDERYLPARDKGPVRRFVRDFVDSRFCIAEYFLPLAVIILILSVIQVQNIQNISLLLWLGVIVLIVVDSIGLGFRLKKQLAQRFPDTPKRGAVAYGLMRTLQMRRLRLPKPQVKRGERP